MAGYIACLIFMASLILPIGALLLGIILLLLGVGLLNTILALRSAVEGYSDSMLGFIMSSYFVGFFIGTYLALPLVRRTGHIRAFAACASIVSICVLMHQILINPYAWMLIRVVTGICLVILYTIIESWLNGQTPPEQRGKVFALYMTANLGALALAQQLLLVDENITFLLFALASVLVSLSLVPVTWTRMQQPVIENVSKIKLKRLWQTAPVAVCGAFLSGLAMGAFWGLSASFGHKMGLTTSQVASFITFGIIGGALLQFPLGKYSDSHDRRSVLMIISCSAALFSLFMFLFSGNHWGLYLSMTAYGGVAFAVYPVAVAHLVDHLQPEDMLSGGSGILLLHGIGAMLGPLLAGQLMSWIHPASLPLYWSAIQMLMALICLFYLKHSKAENPDEHAADFIPMVRTTPSALEMLPAENQGETTEDHTPVWGNETPQEDTVKSA